MIMCQKSGCPSAAKWGVKICVPDAADPEGDPAASAIINLSLCETHLDEADAQRFLDADPRLWDLLYDLRPHGVNFAADRVYIAGVPLNGPEFAVIEQAGKPN